MEKFELGEKDFVELHDLLKVMGLCGSGGLAKKAISEGQVKVDGAVEKRKRCKLRIGRIVEFAGRQISIK